MTRSGQLQGENRKEYLRITRIFDAEDGCFWVKRRRFRFFKQALLAGKKLCVSANVGARIGSSVTLARAKNFVHLPMWVRESGPASRWAGKKLRASANVGARIGSSVTLGGQKTSHTHQCGCANRVQRHAGAGGRTRTGTVSLPMDFESITSANSITPAYNTVIIHQIAGKSKHFF